MEGNGGGVIAVFKNGNADKKAGFYLKLVRICFLCKIV
jgi:hypothetical protein